jgi:hypothetical protein
MMNDSAKARQAGDEQQAARGLCAACRYARVITSDRGAEFVMCGKSKEDPRFTRYPRLPVRQCGGYDPKPVS